MHGRLVWLGELANGRELLAVAQASAAELGDAWGGGVAEEMLGWSDIAAARYGHSERHLLAALAVDALGPLRAGAVEGMAQTAAARRDPDRALCLLGISQRLLADFNTECAPPIAARSTDLEAKLRDAVGPRQAAAKLAQVESHIEHACKMLDVNSRTKLAMWGREQNAERVT